MRRFFSGSFVSSLLVPFQISFDTKRRQFCSLITWSKRTLLIIVYYLFCQLLQTRLDKCTRVLFSFRSEWNRREKRLVFGFLERSRELIRRSGRSRLLSTFLRATYQREKRVARFPFFPLLVFLPFRFWEHRSGTLFRWQIAKSW